MKKYITLSLCGIMSILMFTGCGSTVKQVESKIELGAEVNLIDLVECKEGTTVSVKNKNDFDNMAVGSYDVVFEIKTEKGEKTEETFTFEIVDTTAPKIETGEKLTLIKGIEFNVEELVSATDLSGEFVITSSVEVDTNVPGDYPITVTVTDASDNQSTKDIIVTVIERTKTNFRNAIWGDNIELVKSLETATPVSSNKESSGYKGTVANLDALIFYYFDESYGLHRGVYYIDKDYSSAQLAIKDYKKLKEALVDKYGSPTSSAEPGVLSTWHHYIEEDLSLKAGYSAYMSTWDLSDTTITLEAWNAGKGLEVVVFYDAKGYSSDYSGDF